MLDDFRKALEELQKLPANSQERQYAITWLIVWTLLFLMRYVITGIVVFALGRRIINAFAHSVNVSREGEKRA